MSGCCVECHMTKPLRLIGALLPSTPSSLTESSAVRVGKSFFFFFLLDESITSSENVTCSTDVQTAFYVWVTDWKQFSLISWLCNQTLLHSENSLLYRPYRGLCCCKCQCVFEAIYTVHSPLLCFSSPSAGHEVY